MRIFVWPGHAYLPGLTARHPDGLFDDLCRTAEAGMTSQELANSDAWGTAQGYFSAGFFWEANRVWTAVCAHIPLKSKEWLIGQAAVKLSKAALDLRMGEIDRALDGCDTVEAYVMGYQGVIMNIQISWFAEQVDLIRKEAKQSFVE